MNVKFGNVVVASCNSGVSKKGNPFCRVALVVPDLGLVTVFPPVESGWSGLAVGEVLNNVVLDLTVGYDGNLRLVVPDGQ